MANTPYPYEESIDAQQVAARAAVVARQYTRRAGELAKMMRLLASIRMQYSRQLSDSTKTKIDSLFNEINT